MEAALRGISDALRTLIERIRGLWADPESGAVDSSMLLWVLVGLALLLIVIALLRRRPSRPAAKAPQLLVTRGEVVPDNVVAPSLAVRRSRERNAELFLSASGVLSMTVSNMGRYPVQLLEAALRPSAKGPPTVVDLGAVVPAMGSAEVEARLPMSLRGDGVMDLYCYAAATRHKLYRHRVELVWEPWAERFKVAPLDQQASLAKRLASDEPQARFQMPPPPRSVREAETAAHGVEEAGTAEAVPSAARQGAERAPAPSAPDRGALRPGNLPRPALVAAKVGPAVLAPAPVPLPRLDDDGETRTAVRPPQAPVEASQPRPPEARPAEERPVRRPVERPAPRPTEQVAEPTAAGPAERMADRPVPPAEAPRSPRPIPPAETPRPPSTPPAAEPETPAPARPKPRPRLEFPEDF